MDWEVELVMAFRALLAAFLGGIVGFERERHGQDAGIRTYGAVALGACVFGLVSMHALGGTNVDTRIAAQVVSGVGFLGAGVIMRESGKVSGLTTAATVWASASIGLAMSFGMYLLGILTTGIIFFLLASHHLPGWKKLAKNRHVDHD
jgi:putative Mg2+ transporter-C (MgtC) family protein